VTGDGQREYERRVNRVIDHVRQHLADDLSLAAVARVAAFSPFHFARVFRAVTGETLFEFIQRLRIEKAAGALLNHPQQKVLAIALDHGFASAATFARAFRARFGMTATRWRAGGSQRWSARQRAKRNPGKRLRTPRKAQRVAPAHAGRQYRPEVAMAVHVRDLPRYRVACMRYVGPYGAHGIPELWVRLLKWIAAHELALDGRLTIGVAHDDPSITAPERCRYDAGVVVGADIRADGLVDIVDLPAGRCALSEFVGTAHDIQGAWDRVFRAWLPTSGYQPDDRPCVELYHGDPTVDARTRTFRCELGLPVRPL
jgi:AraC family transcriptional regulator